jgi:hypothetical protein
VAESALLFVGVWSGGVLFAVALVLGAVAPVLDLVGALDPRRCATRSSPG